MMQKEINLIQNEVEKVISGKTEVIRKILMAILAEGHILLDDVPGVGKTTMAVALGKTMNLVYNRVQFTPDVLPSDIVGFSMYNKETGAFEYKPGIVTETNLLLGDEINRTSSKTQSALLEAMEENQVTVDGHTYPLKAPFIVIATQNTAVALCADGSLFGAPFHRISGSRRTDGSAAAAAERRPNQKCRTGGNA